MCAFCSTKAMNRSRVSVVGIVRFGAFYRARISPLVAMRRRLLESRGPIVIGGFPGDDPARQAVRRRDRPHATAAGGEPCRCALRGSLPEPRPARPSLAREIRLIVAEKSRQPSFFDGQRAVGFAIYLEQIALDVAEDELDDLVPG